MDGWTDRQMDGWICYIPVYNEVFGVCHRYHTPVVIGVGWQLWNHDITYSSNQKLVLDICSLGITRKWLLCKIPVIPRLILFTSKHVHEISLLFTIILSIINYNKTVTHEVYLLAQGYMCMLHWFHKANFWINWNFYEVYFTWKIPVIRRLWGHPVIHHIFF